METKNSRLGGILASAVAGLAVVVTGCAYNHPTNVKQSQDSGKLELAITDEDGISSVYLSDSRCGLPLSRYRKLTSNVEGFGVRAESAANSVENPTRIVVELEFLDKATDSRKLDRENAKIGVTDRAGHYSETPLANY